MLALIYRVFGLFARLAPCQSGATDDEFLRQTCAMLLGRGAEVG